MKTKTTKTTKKSLQISMLNKILAALVVLFVATWYPIVWFTIATTSVGVLATTSDMTFDSTMALIVGFALTLVIYKGILPMIVE